MAALPIYPFILAVLPVFNTAIANLGRFEAKEMLMPLGVMVLLTGFVYLVARLAMREWQTAGLVTGIFLLEFFYFKSLVTLLSDKGIFESMLSDEHLVFIFYALFLVAAALRIREFSASVRRANAALNIILSVMLLTAGIQGLSAYMREASVSSPPASAGQRSVKVKTENEGFPNIYVIILDGYGRFDRLKDYYGVDSSRFEKKLRELGFYIASDACANYHKTIHSLNALLNMNYIEVTAPELTEDLSSTTPLVAHLNHNQVMSTLKSMGYSVTAVVTGYSGTGRFDDTDETLMLKGVTTEFQDVLIAKSPFRSLLKIFGRRSYLVNFQYYVHRQRLQYAFDIVPRQARQAPQFVFAHIMTPHPPFVFKRDGSPVNHRHDFSMYDGNDIVRLLGKKRYIAGYAEQIVWVNELAGRMLERLIAADPSAMILLTGDHGPGARLNWLSMEKSELRERLPILHAYRVPASIQEELYPAISPVNSFRLIFSSVFGLNLPLLPDRSHYFDLRKPYQYHRLPDSICARR